jgi:hypothetical protein
MPEQHPSTERIGGGASHENRKQPDKSVDQNDRAAATHPANRSKVSGGGGEHDAHHTHDSNRKAGK